MSMKIVKASTPRFADIKKKVTHQIGTRYKLQFVDRSDPYLQYAQSMLRDETGDADLRPDGLQRAQLYPGRTLVAWWIRDDGRHQWASGEMPDASFHHPDLDDDEVEPMTVRRVQPIDPTGKAEVCRIVFDAHIERFFTTHDKSGIVVMTVC